MYMRARVASMPICACFCTQCTCCNFLCVCVCVHRYQGVDWSDPSTWGCNRGLDPSGPGDFAYDGSYLDPMEVRVSVNRVRVRVRGSVNKCEGKSEVEGPA